MIGHVTVGTNDLARAGEFYDAVLATLGRERGETHPDFISYGERSGSRFFVMRPFDGNPATVGNGVHVAFIAPDRAAVDAIVPPGEYVSPYYQDDFGDFGPSTYRW